LGDPINGNDPSGLLTENDGGDDGGGDGDQGPACDPEHPNRPDSCFHIIPGQPAKPGKPKAPPSSSLFPTCNPSGSPTATSEISFILTNYQAAAAVATEADQDFQGLNAQNFNAADVLGWAAAESGYQPPSSNPDSGLKSGNLDYFNLTAGSNWINQATCPSGANSYWACFGGFQGAAEAALFSPTQYSYQGAPNVSAGFVLGQQLGSGAGIASAFQAMSNAVHYAQSPNYGTGVQAAISSVSGLLNCLQQNHAF